MYDENIQSMCEDARSFVDSANRRGAYESYQELADAAAYFACVNNGSVLSPMLEEAIVLLVGTGSVLDAYEGCLTPQTSVRQLVRGQVMSMVLPYAKQAFENRAATAGDALVARI